MADTPTRRLATGDPIPVVGAGTYDLAGDRLATSLRAALDAGYTHFDTAEGYHNEARIGDLLAERDRDREDLFLTSKVLPSNLDYESLLDSLSASLDRLGTDYLDLYLVHWPNPAISLRETLGALERAHERGLVRAVGVSNFSRYQLRFARRIADVPIAVNQIELHPWYYREGLVEYCRSNDVVVEAAAPLARCAFLDDPTVGEIAAARGKSPAQVALRWAVGKGAVVLPRSASPDHIAENRALFDWELSADEEAAIDDIDRMENVYMIDLDDETYGVSP